MTLLVGCNNQRQHDIDWTLPSPTVDATQLPALDEERDASARKQAFTDFLLPMIHTLNEAILTERNRLLLAEEIVDDGKPLPKKAKRFLHNLAKKYKLKRTKINDAFFTALKQRVDVIPPNLILAQAANESAWGTSRFAQQGNNLFGQWCYQQGCGLVPKRRRPNATHEVQKFRSAYLSLAGYMRNLNTNDAYKVLRDIRAEARKQGAPIRGEALAKGLTNYSERGAAYVASLIQLMEHNADLWPDTIRPPSAAEQDDNNEVVQN